MVEQTAHMVLCRFNSTGLIFFLFSLFSKCFFSYIKTKTNFTQLLITYFKLKWRGGIVDALDLGSNIPRICRFNSVAIIS
jgi:hypothetical protein